MQAVSLLCITTNQPLCLAKIATAIEQLDCSHNQLESKGRGTDAATG